MGNDPIPGLGKRPIGVHKSGLSARRRIPRRRKGAVSGSKHNQSFGLVFVERLFEGSPRWRQFKEDSATWKAHKKAREFSKSYKNKKGRGAEIGRGSLDRDPTVNDAIKETYKRPNSYQKKELMRLCMNPDCDERLSKYLPPFRNITPYTVPERDKRRKLYKEGRDALDDLLRLARNGNIQHKKPVQMRDGSPCFCVPVYRQKTCLHTPRKE